MGNSPSVFIVILNYNGGEDLARCLESVFSIKYPKHSVVLVDNASSDNSFDKARERFSGFFFIRNSKNLGFAAGNNVGIKFSLERGAECVLLLNNDTLVKPDFLEKLILAFEKNPRAGIASPVIFGRDGAVWFSGGKIDWLRMRTVHWEKICSKMPYSSQFITGCAMMIKREVFEKTGFLDEEFFLYYEDADFSLRAHRAGFENIVLPASKIIHLEKSQEDSETKTYWLVFSGLVFFRKRTPFLFKFWQKIYLLGRKIKNRLDIKRRGNRIDLAVRKAYLDFSRYERPSNKNFNNNSQLQKREKS